MLILSIKANCVTWLIKMFVGENSANSNLSVYVQNFLWRKSLTRIHDSAMHCNAAGMGEWSPSPPDLWMVDDY